MSAPLILIVDDNPANLDLLSNLLMGAGYEVAVATDGPMGLELAAREPPALILLDIELPGIDGFETLRRLKDSPASRDIPVIFLTARSDSANKLKGLRAGAVDYVAKPYDAEEMLARINVHLKLQLLARELLDSNERLLAENRARASAESALTTLTHDLERRVDERTADFAQALRDLEAAQAELMLANEALARAGEARERELSELRSQLARELAERERASEERLALREEIIAAQRMSLAELSTPLIPVADTVMVMPMIGAMNEERAKQMLEAALAGVVEHRAEVVILDVTGLKRADAGVASVLVRTADALRLLGAQAIITGVRPELSQVLVAADLTLGDVVTLGTLKAGVAHALERTRGRVKPQRGARR